MSKKNKVGRPNKVVASIYRKQIDDMIKNGDSPLGIVVWLNEQDPPGKIGKSAIYDYRDTYFDVEGGAVRKYSDMKSQERLEKAVDGRVVEIEKLQRFADEALSVDLDLDFVLDERTTMLDVEKHKLQVKRAGVYAQRVVNDFLKVLEPETAVNVNVGLSWDDRIKEYEKRFRSARDGSDSGDGV
jgi:hypothetical protein